MTQQQYSHTPVLTVQTAELLVTDPNGIYLDATVGLGGHAAALFSKLGPNGALICLDWDPQAAGAASINLQNCGTRAMIIEANYADAPKVLHSRGIGPVDGVLYDLGLSSMQLENSDRGFAFSRSGPLDMRFNPTTRVSAYDIVNSWPHEQLTEIFLSYGEERHAFRIARAIVAERTKAPITTTTQLAAVIERAVWRRGKTHPATKVFQALRIAVNAELDNLRLAIKSLGEILKPGGRAAAITFHSLEDRIVKRSFREMALSGEWELVTRKPVLPGAGEIAANPRARSAKLRVIRKKPITGAA